MYTLDNFYTSKAWAKFRAQLIQERAERDGDLICEHCGQPIVRSYDCIAHHKQELTAGNVNDPTVAFNPDNIELIHHRCHNIIHERYEGFKRRVYIVYGPPHSGKEDWVNSVARPDDLILSIDRIRHAICNDITNQTPARLKPVVFGIRDTVLDQIKTRTGNWRSAYVIGGYPMRTERERLAERLNAEIIFIEATEADCLARTEDKQEQQYIIEWFQKNKLTL